MPTIAGTVHSAQKLFTPEEPAEDARAHPYLSAPDPFAALANQLAGLPIAVQHGSADAVVPVERSRAIVRALERRKGAELRRPARPAVRAAPPSASARWTPCAPLAW